MGVHQHPGKRGESLAGANGRLDLFTPDKVGSSTRATWTLAPEAPMILPDQLGQIPHIAVAAGKTGAMSLMNEDDLGGYSRTKA